MSKTYKIKYDFPHEVGNFTKKEIGNKGGTDAFIFVSMLYPEDGSFSMQLLSKDGRTGEDLDMNEIWKVWSMLSKTLADSEELSIGKRALCQTAFDCVKAAITSIKT